MAAIPLENEIFYPESDGKPMAESEIHLEEMVYVWQALKDRFEDDPDVFVGADLFLYYRKGDRSAVVAPDGFVVKGVPKLLPGNRRRRKYLLWEEGQAPCFVLETTSDSTRNQDRAKKALYETLGVDEYFQFDPLGEHLSPRLQGFRLMGGPFGRKYRAIQPGTDGSLTSQATGVIFRADGSQLRMTNAESGVPLLRQEEEAKERRKAEARATAAVAARLEAEEARWQAEAKATVETEARRTAEDRVRTLEEEIARLRLDSGRS